MTIKGSYSVILGADVWWMPIDKFYRDNGTIKVRCRCMLCGVSTAIKDAKSLETGSRGKKCVSCNVRHNRKATKHGGANTRLYRTWQNMKKRCLNPKSVHFNQYGGRGISFEEAWKDFGPFKRWAHKSGYQHYLTLERNDVNKNYTADNCSWIEGKFQARNRTDTVWITYKGERKSAKEWSEITGLGYGMLKARIYRGVEEEKIFDQPIRGRPRK